MKDLPLKVFKSVCLCLCVDVCLFVCGCMEVCGSACICVHVLGQVVINVYIAHGFHECIIKRHAWIYIMCCTPRPHYWLGHLEWFYQIDHLCCNWISNSNYQCSRLWPLHTEVNRSIRSWRVCAADGINFLTNGCCCPLERSESLCSMVLLTQLVHETFTSNRINGILLSLLHL